MSKKQYTNEEFEQIAAEVVDELYVIYKHGFVDYQARTHKLGWYKEAIKKLLHERLYEKEDSTGFVPDY